MITVRVAQGFQVALNGTVFRAPETVEAPNDVARFWLASGWVVPAEDEKATARRVASIAGNRRRKKT